MTHLNISVLIFLLIIVNSNQIRVDGLLNVTNEAIHIGRKLIEEVNKDVKFSSLTVIQESLKNILEKLIYPFKSLVDINELNTSKLYVDYIKSDDCLKNALGDDISDLEQHSDSLLFLDFFYKKRHGLFDYDHFNTLKVLVDNQEKFYGKSIQDRFNNIHNVITTTCQPNLVDILKLYEQLHWVCKDLSAQQLLYSAIKHVALLDAQYYVASQLARACLKIAFESHESFAGTYKKALLDELRSNLNETDMVERMREAEQDFFERNVKSLLIYKAAMHNEALDIPTCELFETHDYSAELENVFKRHIVNVVDLNDQRSCYHDCPYYQNTKIYGCYDEKVCSLLPLCKGKIVGCGNDITSIEVCASESNSKLKYNHRIAVDGGSSKNDCNNRTRAYSWQRWLYKCSYCMCTCEIQDDESDRYFNLRPVVSDVKNNRIVTDVKLRKVNHVLHIQIEEGKLLAGGVTTSQKWKPVDNYTINDPNIKENIDYHMISWSEGRSVALDTLHASYDKALTGLKITSLNGLLILEIQVTRFNFTTGVLFANTSYWCSNNVNLEKRTELNIEDLKKDDEIVHSSGQYVKFTTSMHSDAGQRTVPLINILPAASQYYGPMSGAALGVKNMYNNDPTLTLQLLSFDFEPYIQV